MRSDAVPIRGRAGTNVSLRLIAVRALARRRLVEQLMSPAVWIFAAFGLALAFFLVKGFVHSVGSGGFDFSLTPLYQIVYGIIGSAFGVAYVRQLFGDGPFAFAIFVALAPLLLYLCLTSIQRFGLERRSGFVDLVASGPADVSSYLFSFFAADAIVVAIYLSVTGLYLAGCGAAWNLATGFPVLACLIGSLLFALSLLAWALLFGALILQPASGVALFVAALAVLAFAEIASFALVGGGPGSPTIAASWIARWLSPFFYLDASRMAARSGQAWRSFASSLGQAALCAALLFGAHALARSRRDR